MRKKRIVSITMDGEGEIILSAQGYPTQVRVGLYPSDKSEMFIVTQNGTWISIECDGKIRIEIPAKTGAK